MGLIAIKMGSFLALDQLLSFCLSLINSELRVFLNGFVSQKCFFATETQRHRDHGEFFSKHFLQ